MPGATETEFFQRADVMDTKVGAEKKADPGGSRRTGFEGDDGWRRGRYRRLAKQAAGRDLQAHTGERRRPYSREAGGSRNRKER